MNAAEQIIIHPQKAKKERDIAADGFLIVTPNEFRQAREQLRSAGGREQFAYGTSLMVAADDRYFIAGPAIGAPVAAMVLEKLIVLGARRIVMYGWCGAISTQLQVGDAVIGSTPVSGEGTSQYYQTPERPLPSSSLSGGLERVLTNAGVDVSKRNIWSTDAPFREDRVYLAQLHDSADVCCVDMEYSALCAVAAFRGIEFGGLFLVSDELYRERWQPGYIRDDFRQKSAALVQLLLAGSVFQEEV